LQKFYSTFHSASGKTLNDPLKNEASYKVEAFEMFGNAGATADVAITGA